MRLSASAGQRAQVLDSPAWSGVAGDTVPVSEVAGDWLQLTARFLLANVAHIL